MRRSTRRRDDRNDPLLFGSGSSDFQSRGIFVQQPSYLAGNSSMWFANSILEGTLPTTVVNTLDRFATPAFFGTIGRELAETYAQDRPIQTSKIINAMAENYKQSREGGFDEKLAKTKFAQALKTEISKMTRLELNENQMKKVIDDEYRFSLGETLLDTTYGVLGLPIPNKPNERECEELYKRVVAMDVKLLSAASETIYKIIYCSQVIQYILGIVLLQMDEMVRRFFKALVDRIWSVARQYGIEPPDVLAWFYNGQPPPPPAPGAGGQQGGGPGAGPGGGPGGGPGAGPGGGPGGGPGNGGGSDMSGGSGFPMSGGSGFPMSGGSGFPMSGGSGFPSGSSGSAGSGSSSGSGALGENVQGGISMPTPNNLPNAQPQTTDFTPAPYSSTESESATRAPVESSSRVIPPQGYTLAPEVNTTGVATPDGSVVPVSKTPYLSSALYYLLSGSVSAMAAGSVVYQIFKTVRKPEEVQGVPENIENAGDQAVVRAQGHVFDLPHLLRQNVPRLFWQSNIVQAIVWSNVNIASEELQRQVGIWLRYLVNREADNVARGNPMFQGVEPRIIPPQEAIGALQQYAERVPEAERPGIQDAIVDIADKFNIDIAVDRYLNQQKTMAVRDTNFDILIDQVVNENTRRVYMGRVAEAQSRSMLATQLKEYNEGRGFRPVLLITLLQYFNQIPLTGNEAPRRIADVFDAITLGGGSVMVNVIIRKFQNYFTLKIDDLLKLRDLIRTFVVEKTQKYEQYGTIMKFFGTMYMYVQEEINENAAITASQTMVRP